jgi:two-component system sensor histidine kinase QseC
LIVVNALVHFNLTPLKKLAVKISSREPEALTPIHFESTPIELKPVLDELNALMGRVNKAFKREQWFIDAAAHELRTPIAALQIHVQNALSAGTELERHESLMAALEGIRRTTRLAEQLLAFSRVASATDDQQKGYLMLDVVCREIARSFEKVFESKLQSVEINVQGECVIKADLGKVERLIQNLLDNASKYGASPGVIRINITTAPDKVELKVSNLGPVIPDDEKSKIFEPYYRVLGQKSSGTGLGLAIVQQIAQQCNANLKVEDMENVEGTSFIVQFPIAGLNVL